MPSPTFKEELDDLLRNFAGRETPLTYCPTLSKRLGFSLWLKREDLLHTGAHKVNNTLGQALLAKHMGKTALVAETGAGQHGVATAAAAARLGLECIVFMGAEDVERQSSNVRRMKLLGAKSGPSRAAPDPQGRHQRGPALLDRRAGDHTLLFRYGGGSAPLPHTGPESSERHRARNPCPDAGKNRAASRCGRRGGGRRLQCHRHVPPVRG